MIKKGIIGLAVCLCMLAASNAWAQTNFVLDSWDPAERVCNPKSYTDLGNGIVRDNVTGLEWEQETVSAQTDLTYQEALDYVTAMNEGSEENHGYTGWRMPTIEELGTLTDFGRWYPDPRIHPVFNSVVDGMYWTSTPNASYTDNVWTIYAYYGIRWDTSKSSHNSLRAVRSGYDRSSDYFVINGDGTVTDPNTGLMWQQCNYGQTSPGSQCTGQAVGLTWYEAVEYVQGLNDAAYLGFGDWRMPTMNELLSLMDYSRYDPATRFPSMMDEGYWSSTAKTKIEEWEGDDDDDNYAWFVDFNTGWIEVNDKEFAELYFRAVRSGSCWSGGDWCIDDSECVDGDFCNGEEVCVDAVCVAGSTPCFEGEYCDELNDMCAAECLNESHCEDDSLYCTGDPECVDGMCVVGSTPCFEDEFCDELNDQCAECLNASHCEDDSLYCTGDPECVDGMCVAGSSPCFEDEYCDELNDQCAECLNESHCEDDNLYCTGDPECVDGICGFAGDPCDDSTSACNETVDQCMECLNDGHCDSLYSCESNVCVPLLNSSSQVDVTLKGPGSLDVFFNPNGIDIALIALTGTTEESSLTIKSKLKSIPVYLEGIDIDGSLMAVKGKGVILAGPLTATGGIGKMHIAGADPGSSIEAAWIGGFSIKGDFLGNLRLTGDGFPPKGLTLGKLSIKGTLDSAALIVSGNVDSVKVGIWGSGSTLAVGVDPGEDGLFFTDDDMTTGGSLGKVKYKYYGTDNGSDRFGIIVDNFLKPDKKVLLPFDDGDFCIWEK